MSAEHSKAPMLKEIVVDVNVHQTRVALLENGDLAELYIERRGGERLVGNIYVGKVQNVLPGMQAAFVDIGLEKNAFLYAGDILADKSDLEFPDQTDKPIIPANIKDIVKPGQQIMLQILKEPVGSKGARVTTNITLPGRNLVLMPTVNYIGVSRRIDDEDERARLRDIIERHKPEGMGVIVRTAAEGKSEEEFAHDLAFLARLWETTKKRAQTIPAPAVVHSEEALLFRIIRDLFSFDVKRLVINDLQALERVKTVAGMLSPEFIDRVELYQGEDDLFDRYELESRIDKLLGRRVWLKSGGYLVIDQTEALTVIDVNTGKYVGTDNLQSTLLNTNLEAAAEIARQLRLRDIGGIIVIDFIDLEFEPDKQKLLTTLQNELKHDRTKSNVVGMTGLGLVEMTRKKVRRSLSATLQTNCPYCRGQGRVLSEESVALKIRKALLRSFTNSACENWLVECSKTVSQCLETRARDGKPIFDKLGGRKVYVRSVFGLQADQYNIQALADPEALNEAMQDCVLYPVRK